MDNLTIWIAVTSAAVVLQAFTMLAMYLALRKTSAKVEGLAEEVKTKVLPTVDLVHNTVTELKPRIETIVINVSESTTLMKGQLERLDATVNDVAVAMCGLSFVLAGAYGRSLEGRGAFIL